MRKFNLPGLGISIFVLLIVLLTGCTNGTGTTSNQGKSPAANVGIAPTPTSVTATPTPSPTKASEKYTATPTPLPTKAPEKYTPTPIPTAATIPTPVPSPAPKPSGSPNSTDSLPAAQAVFTLINQERTGQGLPALKWSNALVRSAHLHNVLMFQADTLSHQLPGETDLFTRINAQGIPGNQFAENIGYGWGSAVQAATGLNAWMFSEKPPDDGHRLNILSKATIVGIDVVINSKINQVWLTEDFAEVM
jgi:uncharacterized protein YkwD